MKRTGAPGNHPDVRVGVLQTPLTPFEQQMLRLVAEGMRRGEIARKLQRSPQTISNSLTTAKDKLGARTLAEAATLVSDLDK